MQKHKSKFKNNSLPSQNQPAKGGQIAGMKNRQVRFVRALNNCCAYGIKFQFKQKVVSANIRLNFYMRQFNSILPAIIIEQPKIPVMLKIRQRAYGIGPVHIRVIQNGFHRLHSRLNLRGSIINKNGLACFVDTRSP